MSRCETKHMLQRAHPVLNQGPADLQSAALATELCTHVKDGAGAAHLRKAVVPQASRSSSWRTQSGTLRFDSVAPPATHTPLLRHAGQEPREAAAERRGGGKERGGRICRRTRTEGRARRANKKKEKRKNGTKKGRSREEEKGEKGKKEEEEEDQKKRKKEKTWGRRRHRKLLAPGHPVGPNWSVTRRSAP